ncbi:hypothetical protein WNY81_20510 [Shewanella frigidimarina]|uniref:hypothetical protein n=1 Tax=Shewanella frigidimarina TaxID=56812 RepID=UPI00317A5973
MSKIISLLGAILTLMVSVAVESNTFELPSDMRFIGAVVDTTPSWQWHVDAAQRRTSDWDAQKREGIKEADGVTRFTYSAKNGLDKIAFIQGSMKMPGSFGRKELLPRVTILEASGRRLMLNGNVEPQPASITATGVLRNGRTTKGMLSLVIESAYAVQYKLRGDEQNIYRLSYQGDIGEVAAGIINQHLLAEYAHNERGIKMTSVDRRVDSGYDIASVLGGETTPVKAYAILGSFTSYVGQINTLWLDVPETWTATLTAEVQFQ